MAQQNYDPIASAYLKRFEAKPTRVVEEVVKPVEQVIEEEVEIIEEKKPNKKTLGTILEEIDKELGSLLPGNYVDDQGVEHTSTKNEFQVVEDFATLASFLEGNPIAKDVVDKVMDLIWKGQHTDALGYLEKNHQDIKDQVMSLVYLQPHVAAKIASTKDAENHNEE